MLQQFRTYAPTFAFAACAVYLLVQALTGDKGLLSESSREETLAQRRAELVRVTAERRDLEARVRLLRDANLSRDLLEERARVMLGFADPRDYVIRVEHADTGRS